MKSDLLINQHSEPELLKLQSIRISLASPKKIKQWAKRTLPNGDIVGQVTNAQTVNYKTLKPEKGGLFCERIFGPVKDFQCACGKQKTKTNSKVCSICGVEYISARSRRYKLGYIQLVSPVTHIWYLKGSTSYISLLLNIKKKNIEALTYCSQTLSANVKSYKHDLTFKNLFPLISLINYPPISKKPTQFGFDMNLKENLSDQSKKHNLNKNEFSDSKNDNLANPKINFIYEKNWLDFILTNQSTKSFQKNQLTSSTFVPILICTQVEKITANKELTCLNSKYFENAFIFANIAFLTTKNLNSGMVEMNSWTSRFGANQSKLFGSKSLIDFYKDNLTLDIKKATSSLIKEFDLLKEQPLIPTEELTTPNFDSKNNLDQSTKQRLSSLLPSANLYSNSNFSKLDLNSKQKTLLKNRLDLNSSNLTSLNASILKFQSELKSTFQLSQLNWFQIQNFVQNLDLLFLTSLNDQYQSSESIIFKINKNKFLLKNSEFQSNLKPKEFRESVNQKTQWISSLTAPPKFLIQKIKISEVKENQLEIEKSLNFQKLKALRRVSSPLPNLLLTVNFNIKGFVSHDFNLEKQISFNPATESFENDSSFYNENQKDVLENEFDTKLTGLFEPLKNPLGNRKFRCYLASKTEATIKKSFLTSQLKLENPLKEYQDLSTNDFQIQSNVASNIALKKKKLIHLFLTFSTKSTNPEKLINDFFGTYHYHTFYFLNFFVKTKKQNEFTVDSSTHFLKVHPFFNAFYSNDFLLNLKTENLLFKTINNQSKSGFTETKTLINIDQNYLKDESKKEKITNTLNSLVQIPFQTNKKINQNSTHLNQTDWIFEEQKQNTIKQKKVIYQMNEFDNLIETHLINKKPNLINNYYTIPQSFLWRQQIDWDNFLTYMTTIADENDQVIPFYTERSITFDLPLTGAVAVRNLLRRFNPPFGQKQSTINLLIPQIKGNILILNQQIQNLEDFFKFRAFFIKQKSDKSANQSQSIPVMNKAFIKLVTLRSLRAKAFRRLKMLRPFKTQQIRPEWMILSVLPVLPPDLRPILPLDSQQVAVSDLNKLYQTVLFRNERIKRFYRDYYSLNFSEEMRYAQRLVQEAVDALIENGKGDSTPMTASNQRPLKSLSDMVKGKKGRFRQNLLGKRVDYSGRSVIVVGPQLKLHECGLPKEMAIELFQPFLIRQLILKKITRNFISAKKLIKAKPSIIWGILREVMENRPILLNRAPTLHRLGIQAFKPKLVSGRAILLHPLVCPAFNADFDGDQMAVHVPLSYQACSEAWKLMWARNNLLSPATGEPIVVPSQDMVLGCYYLTTVDLIKNQSQLKALAAFVKTKKAQFEVEKTQNFSHSLNHSDVTFSKWLSVNQDLSDRKITYFSNIEQVLQLLAQQSVDLHTIIWLKWHCQFELNSRCEKPLETRIDQFGNIIQIYNEFQIHSNFKFRNKSFYIKTTPGRVLINQYIYDLIK
uniref:DNA-directed RNA polymerase subunit beta' n=1 Tax=Sykidion marinum TaxID=44573 RepID=A0A1W6EGK7_SYKMA|nr:beta' subunit of RNA polymerase [Pseudoneochloris marina]ARK14516.1 beta' subunit of RNA polymerase [Pseudoneochloris marina]